MASYLIARIIGNSLPPRQSPASTLKITDHIVRNEPQFQDSRRLWILNRITRPAEKSALATLFERAGETFIDLPFDAKAHYEAFLDATGLPPASGGRAAKGRAADRQEWILRHKSQQLIGINHARNHVLAANRGSFDWTLVLDGGVMFTAEGWKNFVAGVTGSPEACFGVIAMRRALSWEEVGDGVNGEDGAEPQIAFHRSSTEIFDERLRYGNRNKAELLSRLRVPGPWLDQPVHSWDRLPSLPAPNAGRFVRAGSVVRLPAEGDGPETNSARFESRIGGVANRSREEDVAYARLIRKPAAEFRSRLRGMATSSASDALARLAEDLLAEPDRFIVDKRTLAPGGGIHDYVSAAPYWSKTGRYVDGVLQDPLPNSDPLSGRYDHASLQLFMRRSHGLAVAGRLMGRKDMSTKAAELVRAWMIDPATRMNPTAVHAQRIPGRESVNPVGIVEFRGFATLPYALRLLAEDGALRQDDIRQIKAWFAAFLNDCTRAGILSASIQKTNNIGTWAAATFCGVALFAGEHRKAFLLAREASVRLGMQLDPASRQVHEVKRSKPLHYSLFNLSAWWTMKRLAGEFGIDLLAFKGARKESLANAIRHCAGNRESFADYAASPRMYDAWIAALLDLLAGEAGQNRTWFIKTYDWGLPPIIARRG
jgi:hypothetical protein